jgi:hypothetical protein
MIVDREITLYGFRFGAAEVERTAELPDGGVVVTVRTESKAIEVYVSAKGGSVRVFRRGKELK